MSPPLQIEGSQLPVTSLNAARNLIFVGQGFSLSIIDSSSHQVLLRRQIFGSQAIHGVTVYEDNERSPILLLIWGGRQICGCVLVPHQKELCDPSHHSWISLEQSNTVDAGDWIFDVKFTPSASCQDAPRAMLVTAHNHLHKIRLSKSPALYVTSLSEGPRCGLYSATLQWISGHEVLVAAGTAFGEIVVWSSRPTETGSESSIHFVLTGHEGSIFGVRISQLISLKDGGQLRLLASCSDDRTIRVWDITDLSRDLGPDFGAKHRGDFATGFLEYNSDQTDALSRGLCIASAMGHQSRIWNVHFRLGSTREASGTLATLVSVGEDATTHSWRLVYRSGSDPSFSLTNVGVARHHQGKNIWSSFACDEFRDRSSILTGGADGKIVRHTPVAQFGDELALLLEITDWSIEDVTCQVETDASLGSSGQTQVGKSTTRAPKGCFRCFELLKCGRLLATTNEGDILLSKERDASPAWEKLGYFAGLQGYSVSCRLTRNTTDYVFLGDAHGGIYYYRSDIEMVNHLTTVEGKITKLLADGLPSKSSESISLVLVRHGALPPSHIHIQAGDEGSLFVVRSNIIGTDSDEVLNVTSCVVATQEDEELGLIFGRRNGTICSYSRSDLDAMSAGFRHTMPHAHGKEAVTALRWIPQHQPGEGQGCLFSVGRDGTLAVHRFHGDGHRPELIHQLALPFGPNLEGLFVDINTQKVWVWGFSSRYFICHDVSAIEDLVRIECGGAHRLWSFRSFTGSDDAPAKTALAWVRAMKLSVSMMNGTDHKVIQPGLHGREMKACAVASRKIDEYLGPLVATGAEDTTVIISHITSSKGLSRSLQHLAVIRKHTTGIQALRWSRDGQFLFSCGGFSELFVWKVEKAPGIRIGVICLAQMPLEKDNLELRITDIDIRQPENLAPEYEIAISLSDSSIQIWSLRVLGNMPVWQLLASSRYTSRCITNISYLQHSLLVTGSTDGKLVCWSRGPTDLELITRKVQSLHQSSIKGLDVVRLNASTSVILTSGDDNAVGCNLITSDTRHHSLEISSVLIPKAHAAAIGAIKSLFVAKRHSHSDPYVIRFVTASNDQRVKIWDLVVNCGEDYVDQINVAKVGCWVSAVADISCLDTADEEGKGHGGRSDTALVLICGVGAELWRAHSKTACLARTA